jgi:hypothetical protein
MGPSDQLLTNSASWHSFLAHSSEKAQTRKPRPCKHFHSKAGDRIRTDDVQLGKHNKTLCRNRQKSCVRSILAESA